MQQEINQYRVEDPFQVCFDDKGMAVIVRDSVITIDDRCTTLTAFDFDNELLDEAKEKEQERDEEGIGAGLYTFYKGARFNGKGHDWLIMDNYLSLSYSYMNFVIKDMIERSDPNITNRTFDLEPYNYIFNKRTCFTDSEFIT